MAFMISGLDYQPFAALFGMSDAQLKERGVVRRVVDEYPGFPCRVSLEDVQIGETVMLVNYEHLPVESPYRATHAIYVRENARRAKLKVDEIPQVMRTRLLSMRAYDRGGMMVSADVAQGEQVDPLIRKMLADPRIAYIHAHNAKPGCYSARIDRA
jgi:hypothetical protein